MDSIGAEREAVKRNEKSALLQGALCCGIWHRIDDFMLLSKRAAVFSDFRDPDLAWPLSHPPLIGSIRYAERQVLIMKVVVVRSSKFIGFFLRRMFHIRRSEL